jgi:hypothetical protein
MPFRTLCCREVQATRRYARYVEASCHRLVSHQYTPTAPAIGARFGASAGQSWNLPGRPSQTCAQDFTKPPARHGAARFALKWQRPSSCPMLTRTRERAAEPVIRWWRGVVGAVSAPLIFGRAAHWLRDSCATSALWHARPIAGTRPRLAASPAWRADGSFPHPGAELLPPDPASVARPILWMSPSPPNPRRQSFSAFRCVRFHTFARGSVWRVLSCGNLEQYRYGAG